MFWRLSSSTAKVYDLCKELTLPSGVVISHDFDRTVRYISEAKYQQSCYKGTPMLNTNVNLIMKHFSEPLPVMRESWEQFTMSPNKGVFIYSVVPIVYSISIAAVITWFLTIFVMANYTIKPSLLLKSSAILSSGYMVITVIKLIVTLHNQQRQGYLQGDQLLSVLNTLTYLNAIDMFVTLLLQINQVQVVMRLFLRQSDKRIVFLVGVFASVTSQTLWSISKFHNFADSEEAGQIVPAFTYLIRIATSVSYAAIFTAFLGTKIKTLLMHRSIWPISILTLTFIYSPVAFFIADVSSTWVYELSEVFSVVNYVICVVIPWEWCNKYNVIRKIKEKEGVLGRRFHEDELYELDRFELFVEEEDPDQESTSIHSTTSSHDTSSGHGSESSEPRTQTDKHHDSKVSLFSSGILTVRDRFLEYTDKIIATGLAIPRSVSAGSVPTPHMDRRVSSEHTVLEEQNLRRTNRNRTVAFADTVNSGRNGRDVFVYSTRDVVVTVDD